MKPPPFDYFAPSTVPEAIELLTSCLGEARLLAGGQSLLPLLNFRLIRPQALVDLGRIPTLRHVSLNGDQLVIGAMTTHRDVELSAAARRCAMLAEALSLVGHLAIRNVGTVGGSLAHADPAAEWPALALALDARFLAAGPTGDRWVSSQEFFRGWMETALEPDEVLTEVHLTLPRPGAGSAFVEVARRHGDFAQAGAAVVLDALDGSIAHVRIVLLGVGTTAVRARHAEELLLNSRPSRARLAEAAAAAAEGLEPFIDVHASAEYKRQAARFLTERALSLALERLGGSQ